MSHLAFWLEDQLSENREYLNVLSRNGFDVITARSNKELVDKLRLHPRRPNLIIHGLRHPDGGIFGDTDFAGWILQERFLQLHYSDVPMIILSNTVRGSPEEKRKKAEANGVILLSKAEYLSVFDEKIRGVSEREENIRTRYYSVVEVMSKELARHIARDPRFLRFVEWRDLERVIATVFQGAGFAVELTPASKDKGRDVIVECHISGKRQSYLIEIKHWSTGKKVGAKTVYEFVEVVLREGRTGGFFLATAGYSQAVASAITEIERRGVFLGNDATVVALCRTFTYNELGINIRPCHLIEIISVREGM